MSFPAENTPIFQSLYWALPFVGVLLSIALLPVWVPRFWHAHTGKVTAFWAGVVLVGLGMVQGMPAVNTLFFHVLLLEYLPFIMLLSALYTVAGGIRIRGHFPGTPAGNTALLALGTSLASVIGTTGAAMLLIRPMLAANARREKRAHMVVFFIFLVANIGGALTPLGDPPLFLGFLRGVSFFWTTQHLWQPMVFISAVLLLLFYIFDRYYFKKESEQAHSLDVTKQKYQSIALEGWLNVLLLLVILGVVLWSGLEPSVSTTPHTQAYTGFLAWIYKCTGVSLQARSIWRDGILAILIAISWYGTPKTLRRDNAFSWLPMKEVMQLFAAIFLTMAPVLAMLQAGDAGPLAMVGQAVNDAQGQPQAARYFWITGLLSSFLDNAPTYLVFFNVAGGQASSLMQEGALILAAISAGAVFMGANTYIGNAPNLMVRSIAAHHGVAMPSFFGYMAWSACLLLPLFALTAWIFL